MAGTYPISFSTQSLAAANYTFTYVNGTLTISGGASQSITFGALANATYGASPITLGATASSGLPVSYTVTGPATVSGSTLSITGAGTVKVTASQAGNSNYAAATSVSQSFTVNSAALTVTANNASRQYGAANPTFTYTLTGLVNGDTSSVVTGTATETTTTTTTSVAGTYPISFSTQSLAAANYTFTYVNGTLTISGGASQSITFGALANATYGASAITLGATASSGLPVSYTVTGPATVSGSTLSITGAGTVSVTAAQAGNANYAAATSVSQSFTVGKAVLTVTADNASIVYGQALPSFGYTLTGFVGTDTSSVVTGTATETTTATSTSAVGAYPISFLTQSLAAANYTFTYVNGTLTISGGASQSITFGALANATYGASAITLGATASSGLPVSYTVTGPATVSGSTLTITGAGTVSVTASQAGNANYAAATSVSQSFTVGKVVLTVTANNASRQYGAANPAFTYTLTGLVNGDTSSVVTGTATETTTATSTSAVGTYPISFSTQSLAAANYTFTYVNGTQTISGGASQSITFGALANATYGASAITLGATASSGLPVSYTVTGPATVSGSTLTITGAGTVSVTASQAGNSNYAAATSVSQSFTVGKAALTVTANNASRQVGGANPAFSYTITGLVNGDTSSVVTGTAMETTTATTTSVAGTYPISFSTQSLAAANYTFTYVSGTLTVTTATQTITFAALPNVTYGVAPITLTATASSGLPVSYTVTGPATVSGSTLSITGAGTVTVTATQAGNSNYPAATNVSQTFTVGKAAPKFTFAVANQTLGTAPFVVSATSNSTGAITYSVVSGPATISGSTITLTGVGTVTLLASQAASVNYTAAALQTSFSVTSPATAVTLQFVKTTLVYPQPPNFEVTIALKGKVVPTGSVQILDGATVVGTYPLRTSANGHISGLVLLSLNVGKHSISAVYSGDKN